MAGYSNDLNTCGIFWCVCVHAHDKGKYVSECLEKVLFNTLLLSFCKDGNYVLQMSNHLKSKKQEGLL